MELKTYIILLLKLISSGDSLSFDTWQMLNGEEKGSLLYSWYYGIGNGNDR